MTKLMIVILTLAAVACSDKPAGNDQALAARTAQPIPDATPRTAAPSAALPAEVAAFKAKRDGCDELRGEEPYGKARAAELAREQKAACTGTDRALAALKSRYAGDPAVTAALADYDPAVE